MSITSLNLALSNRCTARCVFCPEERGRRDSSCMSLPLVHQIFAAAEFGRFFWKLKTVQVGENGDALINPQFLDILRFLKSQLPKVHINLATNMFLLNRRMAYSLLSERLIDSLQLNIDGHDVETFEAQKGISYKRVIQNLEDFVTVRNKLQPAFPLQINVLTLLDYCTKIWEAFNRFPLRSPLIIPPSSFLEVRESLSWLPKSVLVRRSPIFAWAERKMDIEIDPIHYQCPQLPRIENEAFISPSGSWYPCCMDANQDQSFGNVWEKTLREIYHSPERSDFLGKLWDHKFSEIGYPCDRVPFCGVIP